MKNIILVCLSLLIFNGCIKDDNDCLRFSVTYDLVSPDAEGDAPVDANRYSANDIVTVLDTDAVRPGFDFTGWNTQSDGSGDTYLPGETFVITGNVTLYAQWEQVTVEITYLDNGGAGGPFIDVEIPGELYTVLTPVQAGISRANYAFVAWNTESDGNGTSYLPGTEITVEESLTLYALWTPLLQVTFFANGGTGGPVVLNNLLFGTIINYSPEQLGISRPGYTLVAWNTQPDGSGNLYAGPFSITENLILYAVWVPAIIEITYLDNGGVGGPVTDTSRAGEPYTFLTSAQLGISRSGFSFSSWNTVADGSGVMYLPEQSTTIEEDLILYAQWLPIEAGITFVPNGALGTAYTYYVPLNSSFILPTTEELGFSRPGYIFLGWNTQSNGAGATYQPRNVIEVAGAISLYARWLMPI